MTREPGEAANLPGTRVRLQQLARRRRWGASDTPPHAGALRPPARSGRQRPAASEGRGGRLRRGRWHARSTAPPTGPGASSQGGRGLRVPREAHPGRRGTRALPRGALTRREAVPGPRARGGFEHFTRGSSKAGGAQVQNHSPAGCQARPRGTAPRGADPNAASVTPQARPAATGRSAGRGEQRRGRTMQAACPSRGLGDITSGPREKAPRP